MQQQQKPVMPSKTNKIKAKSKKEKIFFNKNVNNDRINDVTINNKNNDIYVCPYVSSKINVTNNNNNNNSNNNVNAYAHTNGNNEKLTIEKSKNIDNNELTWRKISKEDDDTSRVKIIYNSSSFRLNILN